MIHLRDTQLVVVKVGTSLMRYTEDGSLRAEWLESLADDLAALHASGTKIMIVSSGAVGFGRPVLGFGNERLTLPQKQAAAAAGQPHLIGAWQSALAMHDIRVAQILLVLQDSELRRRYLNARNTLEQLLECNIIPIVNENDTVATSELRVGDNDRLAARVAAMVGADSLILLSDVDGLYTKAPHLEGARHIEQVNHIDEHILTMAGDAASATSSGGMRTKIEAAQIATHAGCNTVIASGLEMNPLRALLTGARNTLFTASTTPLAARKQWITGALHLPGKIIIDAGAVSALHHGNSLLPIGIIAVEGDFDRGDTVGIHAPDGTLVAKGITAYNHDEARLLMGHQTHEIETVLGYNGRDNVVHRDDLVMEQVVAA